MTINSMTGFSRATGTHAAWSWTWELKSVNAKGLDVRLRLPMGFDSFEPPARTLLSKIFDRGNVSVNLMLKQSDTSSGYRINEEHLQTLLSAADRLKTRLPDAAPLSIDGILALRGVIEPIEEDVDEAARAALESMLLKSLDTAAHDLLAVREEEGGRLETVLGAFVRSLSELCAQAQDAAMSQETAIRARMKEQLDAIIEDVSTMDAGRLEQEVALLMTKADIREELDRLGAHIASVRELLEAGGAIGRRLDFLCQELNREANTICSKAHETSLTRIGLDLKATIEQFREQVQNIE
ncbi:YicC/YloC family endoribonuclease [Thalassospiraceae bacterium LMO-JJ14]|nr:YicC/YloC family endoribonuclease [Thalassospiraceae bacterium LMO-JJ14]